MTTAVSKEAAKSGVNESANKSDWFLRPFRVESPAFRLFLLHHAGGSATAFYPWLKLFPADWDVVAIELPGRGGHSARPPFRSLSALLDELSRAMAPLTHVPFALFGHSMGAMIAYELQRRLLDTGRPSASWLGLSAKSAPSHVGPATANVHDEPDDVLARYLVSLGGTPPSLLEDAELRSFFLPPFRADMHLVETYAPGARAPIATPMGAFGGRQDPRIPVEGVEAWARETSGPYEEFFYLGGHFYLQARAREVAAAIVASVRRVER